jgi:hypothetical protein
MAELYMRYIHITHTCGCITIEIGTDWYLTAQYCVKNHGGVMYVGRYKHQNQAIP